MLAVDMAETGCALPVILTPAGGVVMVIVPPCKVVAVALLIRSEAKYISGQHMIFYHGIQCCERYCINISNSCSNKCIICWSKYSEFTRTGNGIHEI